MIDFDESEYVPLPIPTLDDVRDQFLLSHQRRLQERDLRQQQNELLHYHSRHLKKGDGSLVGMSGIMKKGDGRGMMGMKKEGGGTSGGRCDVGELTTNDVFNVHIAWQTNGFINSTAGETGLVSIDPSRDTLEYRTFAYDYFRERYGIELDPTDPNPFKTILGDDGVTPIAVLIAGENQNIPQVMLIGEYLSIWAVVAHESSIHFIC
jgi:hypothetical protein